MTRVLVVIPAHNEAASLAAVIADVRACGLAADVIVVDDGSTDGTPALLERLGVPWVRLHERMGVGSAVRAGLRYAVRLGYDAVVRLDGDGQHAAADAVRLLEPVLDRSADVALGSRYGNARPDRMMRPRLSQQLLTMMLCAAGVTHATDPTSGFCAIGREALHVLAEHHPTGYAEPELRLFLHRNRFRVVEVPVRAIPRAQGRTSLTAGRLTLAGARVALALIVVPLRGRVTGAADG